MAQKAKKRTVDKWKRKVWYTIFAPKEFEKKELGDTVAIKPELLEGRRISVGLSQIARQAKKPHVSVKFRVNEVKGNKAYTEAIGHSVKDAYMRRFVRRRSSKIEVVQKVTTKDNVNAVVKTIVVTAKKVAKSRRTEI